jgi:superfamily I DNA and/or RNA helicase
MVAESKFESPYLNNKGLDDALTFMPSDFSTENCDEENEDEAEAVITLVKELLEEGHTPNSIAVITPFRKQVRLIRSKANEVLEQIPLIDTVERLQGQDVDCIILTFATSNSKYISEVHHFLFNPNRLNVMISRAKTKVIIFASSEIQKELKNILNATGK